MIPQNIDFDPDDEDAIASFIESIPEDEFQRMLKENEQLSTDADDLKKEGDHESNT